MNPHANSVVQLPNAMEATSHGSASRRYSVAVKADELRQQMRLRGLTGAELARRAKVSATTVSHALNGRRIHPAKLHRIAIELHKAEPMPGAETLLVADDTDSGPAALDGEP